MCMGCGALGEHLSAGGVALREEGSLGCRSASLRAPGSRSVAMDGLADVGIHQDSLAGTVHGGLERGTVLRGSAPWVGRAVRGRRPVARVAG